MCGDIALPLSIIYPMNSMSHEIYYLRLKQEETDFLNGSTSLFHYTSFGVALQILINNTLKFGLISQMRDPFEYLISDGSYTHWGDKPIETTVYEHQNKKTEFRNEFIAKAKSISFSTNATFIEEKMILSDPNDHLSPDYGYLKHRMWEIYGDSHKGVCLVFDELKIKQLARELKLHTQPVGYTRGEKRALLSDSSSLNHNILLGS